MTFSLCLGSDMSEALKGWDLSETLTGLNLSEALQFHFHSRPELCRFGTQVWHL